MSHRSRISTGWAAVAVVAVLGVLVVTLRPDRSPAPAGGINLEPFSHHGRVLRLLVSGEGNRPLIVRYLLTDVLGNVLLFVPLGVAVGAALRRSGGIARVGLALAVGLGLSLAVEVVQLGIPGRTSDVDDVLFNGLGALVGGIVAAGWVAWKRGRRTRGRGA